MVCGLRREGGSPIFFAQNKGQKPLKSFCPLIIRLSLTFNYLTDLTAKILIQSDTRNAAPSAF